MEDAVRVAAHRDLYDLEREAPVLRGARCTECDTVYFPPMTIGCEVCGALESALSPAPLETTGVIHSVATVHRHHGHDIEAPFTMAEIQLDAGPLIHATMVEVVEPDVIGRRVAARFVVARQDDDGNDVVEPRFEVVAA
jgi:uncharacterized OB-fold protein